MTKVLVLSAIALVALSVVVLTRRQVNRSKTVARLESDGLTTLDAAGEWLKSGCGLRIRPYSTFEFGRERDETAISAIVQPPRAQELLADLRARLRPGLIAYIGTTKWYGAERNDGVELVVARGESQFDIVQAARSSAANYDLDTADLVARLRDYHQRFGIDIFQAETDAVQFRIDALPCDVDALTKELYEFCPDIVDQGCSSVQALADEIRAHKVVSLWWD